MADNPFAITPVNPLQALLLGQQSYDTSRQRGREDEMRAGRLEAVQSLQAGGDLRGPLAKLLGVGDVQGAQAIANFANQQATQDFHNRSLAATMEHQRATEDIARRGLEEKPHYVTESNPLDPSQTKVIRISPKGGAEVVYNNQPSPGNVSPQAGTSNTVPYAAVSPVPMANQGIPGAQPIPTPGQQAQAPPGQQAQAPPVAAPLPPGNPNRERDEAYLQTLPPNVQALVKRLADYDLNPAQLSKMKGHSEAVLGAVARYDPTYDVKNYSMRSQTINAFAKGPPANAVRSFSVALDHLDTLDSLARALHNSDFPAFNAIKNKVQTQIGIEAPGNFDAAKRVIGGEIVKAVIGAAGALGDREEAIRAIDSAKSYPQLKGVIDTYQKLMAGQLQGYQRQYEEGTGRKNFDSFLSEPAKKLLRGGEPARTEPATGGSGTTKSGVKWQILDQ